MNLFLNIIIRVNKMTANKKSREMGTGVEKCWEFLLAENWHLFYRNVLKIVSVGEKILCKQSDNQGTE